ncbi:hypothetical protein ACFL2C_02715 [Patescibacteria group bacterium]
MNISLNTAEKIVAAKGFQILPEAVVLREQSQTTLTVRRTHPDGRSVELSPSDNVRMNVGVIPTGDWRPPGISGG